MFPGCKIESLTKQQQKREVSDEPKPAAICHSCKACGQFSWTTPLSLQIDRRPFQLSRDISKLPPKLITRVASRGN